MRHKHGLSRLFALGFTLLVVLVSACGCGTVTPEPTSTAAPVPTATAPPDATAAIDPAQSPAAESEATSVPGDAEDGISAGEVAAAVASRTSVPTPTPDVIADKVEELTASAGLTGKTFLGLSAENWLDMAVSLVIALGGYLLAMLGVRLFLAIVERFGRRTASGFEHAFVDAIADEIKWLAMVFVLRYSLLRLDFLSDGLRTIIDDGFFVLGLAVIALGTIKVIGFVSQWYRDHLDADKDNTRLEPIALLLTRTGYAFVIIIALSVILGHFGIQITVLAATLVMVAVIIALGARDVISDAISGFIILIDQPFRVGDVIAIEELDTWGDVVEIGTRTTRIRTRDKRFAIIPNSRIAASLVINYTFPDSNYRVYSEIRVAFGSDFDQVRRVASEAVRSVEGVLPDQPVTVLFHEYGVSARTTRVRWWINDMHQEKRIIDAVNEALEIAFDKAGIEMPVTTRDLVVRVDPETAGQPSRSPGEPISAAASGPGSMPEEDETE